MGLFSTEVNNFEELFWEQIKDLYDAENRIIDALPQMAQAAKHPSLQSAFRKHLSESEEHARRLEEIFSLRGKSEERETCEGIKGIIEEGQEMIDLDVANPALRDAALIAAAQRVEHYEIAGYGTARTFAEQLGFTRAAEILDHILREEEKTDQLLSELALNEVNPAAAQGGVQVGTEQPGMSSL